LENNLWQAIADPSQIESAILNLAVNARDAMPNGGRLTIRPQTYRVKSETSRLNSQPATMSRSV
jgi:signal transduction histidine kinase